MDLWQLYLLGVIPAFGECVQILSTMGLISAAIAGFIFYGPLEGDEDAKALGDYSGW